MQLHLNPPARAFCRSSSGTSRVESCPALRAATLSGFRSNPTVGNLVENSLASGRPTYPSPMTAILMLSVFIYA